MLFSDIEMLPRDHVHTRCFDQSCLRISVCHVTLLTYLLANLFVFTVYLFRLLQEMFYVIILFCYFYSVCSESRLIVS